MNKMMKARIWHIQHGEKIELLKKTFEIIGFAILCAITAIVLWAVAVILV